MLTFDEAYSNDSSSAHSMWQILHNASKAMGRTPVVRQKVQI